MENIAPYVQLAGLALVGIGVLWLILAAFSEKLWWGLGALLVFPVVAPIFAIARWRKGLWPFLVVLLGVAVVAIPAVYIRLLPIDLGPRERTIDGKLCITLTGWDRDDYSLLQQKKEVQQLEMANPDVTDDTLQYLRGLDQLEELDLSRSQVTDAGLVHLKELPKLMRLDLSKTKITDAGVEEYLTPMKSLKLLLVEQTEVSKQARQAFRKAGTGRKTMPR